MASVSLLGALAFAASERAKPQFDLPPGFSATVYATGMDGAHDPALHPDGTITLAGRDHDDLYEIAPATPDSPLVVMRVAADLRNEDPLAEKLGWHPELPTPPESTPLPTPQTLAAAKVLDRHDGLDVMLTPIGDLYVADADSGVIWRLSRESR